MTAKRTRNGILTIAFNLLPAIRMTIKETSPARKFRLQSESRSPRQARQGHRETDTLLRLPLIQGHSYADGVVYLGALFRLIDNFRIFRIVGVQGIEPVGDGFAG